MFMNKTLLTHQKEKKTQQFLLFPSSLLSPFYLQNPQENSFPFMHVIVGEVAKTQAGFRREMLLAHMIKEFTPGKQILLIFCSCFWRTMMMISQKTQWRPKEVTKCRGRFIRKRITGKNVKQHRHCKSCFKYAITNLHINTETLKAAMILLSHGKIHGCAATDGQIIFV